MQVLLLSDMNRLGHLHHAGEHVEVPELEGQRMLQAGHAIAGGPPGQERAIREQSREAMTRQPPRQATKPNPTKRKR